MPRRRRNSNMPDVKVLVGSSVGKKPEPKGPNAKSIVLGLMESMCHGIILAMFISVTWFSFVNFNIFSFHPPLFTAGYLIFMTEGFLIFLPHSVIAKDWPRVSVVKTHWLLQVTGFCCIFLGMIAVVTIKLLNGLPHFAFTHSITGLVAVILAVLTGLGGFVSRLKPHPKGPSLAQIKLGHVCLGIAAYCVGIAALVLGYFTNYFSKLVDYEWRVFMAVVTSLVATVALVNACFGFYRRAKNLLS